MLSENGKVFKCGRVSDGKKRFAHEILKNGFLLEIYKDLAAGNYEGKEIEFITECIFSEYNLSRSTSKRRASCIYSWFKWIDNQL